MTTTESPSLWPPEFLTVGIKPDHCKDVLEGCYDIPFEHPHPVILDIGANIGAFAKWARGRWPNALIHCYEPEELNHVMLRRTLDALPSKDRAIPHRVGVMDKRDRLMLFPGKFNRGEFSVYGSEEHHLDKGCAIEVIDAATLPAGDILKIDTEGAEPAILKRLHETGRLGQFSAVMLEWHRKADADTLESLLTSAGYAIHSKAATEGSEGRRGVLKAIRRNALN